ncbi:hypothetical protein [Actinoplanes regularis]|uniref:Uncharacterized protein n=1 Tax=Actinoplanes regularis TaxID=52697 RepID=A0A239HWC8_9ACTN|nr:hypothetical protein [Actinoplanes regularis]GIE91224.1 hypothetical protein Are01nite_77040 [Actinoplanes regularis]GLW34878.1 hypothetical protein Areg01_78140 [Actinoplanes regularis]SNS84993.1 hypothetical protein SAMN06264365_12635 [Actinoplanes regularis]
MTRRESAQRRAADAYDVLRGRRDYKVLVVLPLVAAAGGALIALGLERLVIRRRDTATAPEPALDRRPEPVAVR